MRLRVTTPTDVVLEREVHAVQAEDISGRFGIRAGHEAFLTVLVPSIVECRYVEGDAEREKFVAVRQGVLRVIDDFVQVAVREAHVGDRLEEMQEEIRRARKTWAGVSYGALRSLYQMQISAWRLMLEYEDVRAAE